LSAPQETTAPTAWPSVTAVIPSRGRQALLERALKSILRQRYDGTLRCIVVVDGDEPDGGDARIRAALDARLNGQAHAVEVVRNTRTGGAAGARNTGAVAADGDLVAFCDDDDEWYPSKLREQVAAIVRTGASAATSGIDIAFRHRVIRRLPRCEAVTFEELLRSRRTDMHTSTIVVRRDDFVGRIGPFDERIPGSYGEDYEWLLRAARIAPIVTAQRALAAIHWHEQSYFEGRWGMIVDALRYLLDKHPEFGRDPHGLARIYGQLAFASAALGQRRESVSWARRCVALDRWQPRAYLALLVASRVVGPRAILRMLHRFGRGV
jgi:glycosyltransferase involved in cell wall biosynthesis